ncbi:MAG: M15 family metallopeptidase [Methylococcaceae bacterium]|nr:M15 family metallopeptidase [Methylococcaceae bacterium]
MTDTLFSLKSWIKRFCTAFVGFSSVGACAEGLPQEIGPFRPSELVELIQLDPSLRLDVRYATANNFVGKAVYPVAKVFLQKPVAQALLRVHARLKPQGLGLLLFDGYRPWSVTKLFWDSVSGDQRRFVADPRLGSRHNRGCTVDLSLYSLETGQEVAMPSEFDEMNEKSYPDYTGGDQNARNMRDLLRQVMEAEGFTVHPREWWHFDYKNWSEYAILDWPLTEIPLE